jgi:ABC-type transporter Mla MlaB component
MSRWPKERESPETVTEHSVYDDGVLRMTAIGRPPGLALAGEIDESTYPALVEKLAEFAGPELHLFLADVEYCDLAGLRAMIRLANGRRGSRSRLVVLHDVPARLQTVLSIVGWDMTPGLVIDRRTSAVRRILRT